MLMTCSSCSAKMTATCGRRSASIAKSNLRTICRHCLLQYTSDIILFEFLEMLMMRVLHFQWSPSWKVSFDSPRVLHNFPTSISYRTIKIEHILPGDIDATKVGSSSAPLHQTPIKKYVIRSATHPKWHKWWLWSNAKQPHHATSS